MTRELIIGREGTLPLVKPVSRRDFILAYCRRSKVDWITLSASRDAIPCDCGDPLCEGWQMVPKETS